MTNLVIYVYMHKARSQQAAGFTIVELLVVIVVIGVLAAVTFVTFSGVSRQATVASLQSDLTGSSKLLKLFNVETGSYPLTISTDCSAQPDTTTNKCLKASPGNTYSYTRLTPQSFSLTATNGSIVYRITDDSKPGEVAPLTAIAAIAGTAQEGQILTAGVLSPAGATATYQWQSAATAGGTYVDISGANAMTYSPVEGDVDRYIRVVATGSNSYYGSVTSAASAAVESAPPPTVAIGTQVWMQYNVNVGTRITGGSAQTDNAVVEKWCYADLDSNCTMYGGLYQWNEMMKYSTVEGARGVCPSGFHLPSDTEWKTLEMFLGMTQAQADGTFFRGTDQGTQLKAGGSSNFNALFGGYYSGPFFGVGSGGYFWTGSQWDASGAPYRYVTSSNAGVARMSAASKTYGMSVRCLKN
ncbi:MAG: fibrobacter succinogenes major paralogous domain-containing protein [Coriobacteriia bacterium]